MSGKKEKLKEIEKGIDDELSKIQILLLAEEKEAEDSLDYDFDSLGMGLVMTVDLGSIGKEEEEYDDDDPLVMMDRIRMKSKKKKKLKKELYVKKSVKRIRRDQNVHLVFLCDCTGSMRKAIDKCKENVKKITNLVKKSFSNFSIMVSFVGYRDYSNSSSDRFELLDFTTTDEMFRFMGTVRAISNNDTAEDVFGGIEKVLGLGFDQDHPTRILVHMADAPCHGKQYHDPSQRVSDNHPGGDPDKRDIKKMMRDLSDRRIHYFFVAVPSCGKILTDVMCQKFKEMYEKEDMEFTVFRHTEDYLSLFVKAISSSISKSQKVSKEVVKTEMRDLF